MNTAKKKDKNAFHLCSSVPHLWLKFLVLASLAGCAAPHSDLRFTANDGRRQLLQRFNQSFCRELANGDKEIVLLDDGIAPGADDGRQGLQAARNVFPRQVVYIRMFWKPVIFRPDHPAAANASLHWYVLGVNPADGWIDYSGTALVTFDGSGDTRTIQVITAWMTAVAKHGQLIDPIGLGSIKGDIKAVVDSSRVDTMLEDVRTAISAPVAKK